MSKIIHNKYFYIGLASLAILALAFFVLPNYLPANFVASPLAAPVEEIKPIVKEVKHLKTPPVVKAIYMTACVAGTPSFRARLLKFAQETEINSIIIDVKDYTGTVSFGESAGGGGCRVADLPEFLETLHDNNIYTIARITAFQDPYLAKVSPDWAVKKRSDKTINWKDRKGISFIDAGNKNMWKYLVDLGKDSYAIGFDEINYDYIRFPSDGDMADIYFPSSNEILVANATSTKSGKSIVMRSFFEYLHENFKDTGIVISADLFGMTATNYDDLNIGQILEDAAPNFDFIAPMVYPSHYPTGFNGYKNVNDHPYDIVNYSMKIAAARLVAIGESPLKLRPWLQDNDYPVHYTPEMVRAQIQATYDAGLTSWMLWDAGNTYTQAALLSE
ncbi:MAG: putative glycoside hydrolase [Candidatus Paceibacterota bacterium]